MSVYAQKAAKILSNDFQELKAAVLELSARVELLLDQQEQAKQKPQQKSRGSNG